MNRRPAAKVYLRDKQRRMIVQAGACYQRKIPPVRALPRRLRAPKS